MSFFRRAFDFVAEKAMSAVKAADTAILNAVLSMAFGEEPPEPPEPTVMVVDERVRLTFTYDATFTYDHQRVIGGRPAETSAQYSKVFDNQADALDYIEPPNGGGKFNDSGRGSQNDALKAIKALGWVTVENGSIDIDNVRDIIILPLDQVLDVEQEPVFGDVFDLHGWASPEPVDPRGPFCFYSAMYHEFKDKRGFITILKTLESFCNRMGKTIEDMKENGVLVTEITAFLDEIKCGYQIYDNSDDLIANKTFGTQGRIFMACKYNKHLYIPTEEHRKELVKSFRGKTYGRDVNTVKRARKEKDNRSVDISALNQIEDQYDSYHSPMMYKLLADAINSGKIPERIMSSNGEIKGFTLKRKTIHKMDATASQVPKIREFMEPHLKQVASFIATEQLYKIFRNGGHNERYFKLQPTNRGDDWVRFDLRQAYRNGLTSYNKTPWCIFDIDSVLEKTDRICGDGLYYIEPNGDDFRWKLFFGTWASNWFYKGTLQYLDTVGMGYRISYHLHPSSTKPHNFFAPILDKLADIVGCTGTKCGNCIGGKVCVNSKNSGRIVSGLIRQEKTYGTCNSAPGTQADISDKIRKQPEGAYKMSKLPGCDLFYMTSSKEIFQATSCLPIAFQMLENVPFQIGCLVQPKGDDVVHCAKCDAVVVPESVTRGMPGGHPSAHIMEMESLVDDMSSRNSVSTNTAKAHLRFLKKNVTRDAKYCKGCTWGFIGLVQAIRDIYEMHVTFHRGIDDDSDDE